MPSEPISREAATVSVSPALPLRLPLLLIGGRLVTLGFAGTGQGGGGLYDISSTVHRPDILDRHGRLLATDIKGATLYADPAKVIDIDELAEQVTSVLTDVDAKALRAKLRAGGRFVRIKRELTPKQQEEIHELGLPGLAFIEEYRRVYPMGATASHVVGLVDVDNKGLAGIEKFIDDNPQLTMSDDEAVTISLDLGAQHVLREELGKAIKTYRAKAAAGIVIDVHSGEVLALASLPDYDPNRREQALDKDRLNRIGFGVYEMGSVFKVFTVAGVLDIGLASMRSHYDASSPIHYASFTIDDFHGQHRSLSVPEVFIYSSNIGAAKMALDMGVDRHRAFLKKLGLMSRVSDRDRRERRADHPDALAEAQHHDHCLRPRHVGDAAPARRLDAAARQWRDRRRPHLPAALARGGHGGRRKSAQARDEHGDAEADASQRAERHRQARQRRRLSRRRQDRHGREGGRRPLFDLGAADELPFDLPDRCA